MTLFPLRHHSRQRRTSSRPPFGSSVAELFATSSGHRTMLSQSVHSSHPYWTERRSSIRGRRRRTQRTFWTSLQWTGLLPMAASTHRSTSSPLQVACKYAAFYAINRDVMTRSQLDQFQNRSLALKSFDTISIIHTIPCMAQLLSSALSPFCCRLRPQCRPFDWGFPGANEGVWSQGHGSVQVAWKGWVG